MLPHYSPMKVAESFRVLHALYPGRIDLGIGRAPGGSPLDSFALRRDRNSQQTEDDFPKQLLELIAFLHGGFRPDHAFSRIELSPAMPGCARGLAARLEHVERSRRSAARIAVRVRALHRSHSHARRNRVLPLSLQTIE